MTEIYVEKWLTFTLIDGRWDIQLWPDNAKPINAEVYRLKGSRAGGIDRRHGDGKRSMKRGAQRFVGRRMCGYCAVIGAG